MVRLLVSVRDIEEALAAAEAGADLVDLKEPGEGALGGLAPERIEQVVAALRARHPGLPVSATIGDLPPRQVKEILARVARVAACGVDYVKVGLWPSPATANLLAALADCGANIVPVLVADDGVDLALAQQALARSAFPALMVDTADKGRGSLLQRRPLSELAAFVIAARARGCLAGLAGSLRAVDAPALLELAPDFAGFRGAVTRGERAAQLDPQKVRELRRRLAAQAGATGRLATAG